MSERAVTFGAPARESLERRLFVTLPIAIVAVQLVFGGIDLLLASALDRLAAGTAVTTYGWITGFAWLCALLAYPIAGMASDRTPRRLGRRRFWVVAGSLGSLVGLAILGVSRSVVDLTAGYVIGFGFLPVMLVGLYASIPDRVGPSRRGAIGAIVGAATIAGGVAGNLVAARFADRIESGAIVFGAVLLAGAVIFGWLSGEERADAVDATTASAAGADQDDARRRADFAWFALGRFALFLAYAAVTGLAYYIVRDQLGRSDPANGVAAFALTSGATTLLASLVAGPWSDRSGRRRPFVAAAAVFVGIGALVPAVWSSLTAFLVAGAIIGAGIGVYLAVGTALGTLVLPSAATSGRDIGFMALANASAQAIAPVAGAYVAAQLGYPVLFACAAAACAVAALATIPIRSVR